MYCDIQLQHIDELHFDGYGENEVSIGQEDEQEQQEEQQQFTERMLMRGSIFHIPFPSALKKCKQKLINNDPSLLPLHPEPTNKQDENAIAVQVLIDIWTPIGYIPGEKILKVTDAMRKGEVTNIVLSNVIYRFFNYYGHKYFANILITKRKKWFP